MMRQERHVRKLVRRELMKLNEAAGSSEASVIDAIKMKVLDITELLMDLKEVSSHLDDFNGVSRAHQQLKIATNRYGTDRSESYPRGFKL